MFLHSFLSLFFVWFLPSVVVVIVYNRRQEPNKKQPTHAPQTPRQKSKTSTLWDLDPFLGPVLLCLIRGMRRRVMPLHLWLPE